MPLRGGCLAGPGRTDTRTPQSKKPGATGPHRPRQALGMSVAVDNDPTCAGLSRRSNRLLIQGKACFRGDRRAWAVQTGAGARTDLKDPCSQVLGTTAAPEPVPRRLA
jgi:hypothetical protein